jgi:drug/metabolite transporter (DMT)-like permease
MKQIDRTLKADMMLVMVTLFWGSSMLVTKFALDDLDEFNLVDARFLVGFLFSSIVLFKKIKPNKKVVGYAAVLAANQLLIMALSTFGVRYTSVSKAGLLTCLVGVFVPLIYVVVFRKKIGLKTAICAIVTFIGIYILTMGGVNDDFGINLGDVLCTLCSLFFGVNIMLVGFVVKRVDAITLTFFQTGFVGLYSIVASFIFETPSLPTTPASWLSVLWLGIICGVAAMLLQSIAQKYTTDTHAGIIFTLEPVFALILARVFLGEILTAFGYLGAGIIVLCIVLLEVNFKKVAN